MSWKLRNAGWNRGMKRYQKKGGGYGYYDPNSNEYEYVSSNDLPISDREYELSNNQPNKNENGLYDFATAIENKNP